MNFEPIVLVFLAISLLAAVFAGIQNPPVEAACWTSDVVAVSSSGHETGNPPENTIDGSLATRWSNEGTGSWIKYNIGTTKTLCYVDIAWYNGNQRQNNFVISVSTDGVNYTGVYSGKSTGSTLSPERYDFPDRAAKFIMITVNGNTINNWSSITEANIYYYSSSNDTAAPTVSITSPSASSTVPSSSSGAIRITGTSSDSGSGVKLVEIRTQNTSYQPAIPKAPGDWSSWTHSRVLPPGTHTLVAKAIDNAGNTQWYTISVNVLSGGSDVALPRVSITSPSNGQTITGPATGVTLRITGTSSDSGSGVKLVEIRTQNTSYQPAIPKAPGDWSSWTHSRVLPPGTHTLVAKAIDNAGNTQWHTIKATAAPSTTNTAPSTTNTAPSTTNTAPSTTNTAPSTTNTAPSTTNTASSKTDKFGVTMLYNTKSGGREWSSNWDNGKSRTLVSGARDPYNNELVARGVGHITIDGLGVATMTGAAPRMYVYDTSKSKTWNNVEVTFYAKRVSETQALSYQGFVVGARTNHQDAGVDPCLGAGYYGRMLYDGRVNFQKEIVHHGSYSETRPLSNSKAWWDTSDKTLPRNIWVGYKLIVKTVDNGTHVKMELYRDLTGGTGGGNWQKLIEYTDAGGWGQLVSGFNVQKECGRSADAILLDPGTSVFIRNDGVQSVQYKMFSVREIA